MSPTAYSSMLVGAISAGIEQGFEPQGPGTSKLNFLADVACSMAVCNHTHASKHLSVRAQDLKGLAVTYLLLLDIENGQIRAPGILTANRKAHMIMNENPANDINERALGA